MFTLTPPFAPDAAGKSSTGFLQEGFFAVAGGGLQNTKPKFPGNFLTRLSQKPVSLNELTNPPATPRLLPLPPRRLPHMRPLHNRLRPRNQLIAHPTPHNRLAHRRTQQHHQI